MQVRSLGPVTVGLACGALVVVFSGFLPQQSETAQDPATRFGQVLGTRIQCKGSQDIFSKAKHSVVPFETTVYNLGDFALDRGRVTIPADGIYLVEANVSVRSQSPKLTIGTTVRMAIGCRSGIIAADSTTQLDEEKRTTCLAASTTCILAKGDEVFVELGTEMPDDPELKYPVLAGEKGSDVCHLTITRLGRPHLGSK